MKNIMKLLQLMGIMIVAVFISSGVARGDGQKIPIIEKKAKRLKTEAKVFTKSVEKTVSNSAAQDVFVDKDGDGINDLLDKKKDDKSVIKFMNEKGNKYFSSSKSANVSAEKKVVETQGVRAPEFVNPMPRQEKPVVEQARPQPKVEETKVQATKISVTESKPNVVKKITVKPEVQKPEKIKLVPKKK